MLVAVHNLYPSLSTYTAPFFQLSYYQPSTGLYIQGWDDAYFVASALVIFMAVRAIVVEWILQPLSRKAGLKRKASVRIAEQGWQFIYYSCSWCFGMYLWSRSPYWLDFGKVWHEWPARGTSGQMKSYLLVQLAFYLALILVINIEERRKDHYQMLSHHIITGVLITAAYIYGFYNVSNVVLCLMDVVDFMLPVRYYFQTSLPQSSLLMANTYMHFYIDRQNIQIHQI